MEGIGKRESGTPEKPTYRKVPADCQLRTKAESATSLYIIVCDEGWRESIVCNGMYEWAADWLVSILQGKPFASLTRPDEPRIRGHHLREDGYWYCDACGLAMAAVVPHECVPLGAGTEGDPNVIAAQKASAEFIKTHPNVRVVDVPEVGEKS